MLLRLLSMYTNINLCCVAFYPWLPPALRDVVRASTLLILIAVSTTWVSGKAGIINTELFDSFVAVEFAKAVPARVKQACVLCFDVLFHVVPLLVIGLPQSSVSVAVACNLLLIWYAVVRHRITEIYAPSVPADKSVACATLAALIITGGLFASRARFPVRFGLACGQPRIPGAGCFA